MEFPRAVLLTPQVLSLKSRRSLLASRNWARYRGWDGPAGEPESI